MMEDRTRGVAPAAVAIRVACICALLFSGVVAAQLTLEVPGARLRPGGEVVLVLPEEERRAGRPVETVLFDDRAVPFEVLDSGAGGALRLRIRVPENARPGGHEIAVLYADAAPTTGVPDVRGLGLAEARRRLAARGLGLDLRGLRGPPAEGVTRLVERQTPAPGARAPVGSPVVVAFSSISTVPDLRGLGLDEARGRLEARGLGLDAPGTASGRAAPGVAWTVIDHEPAAGAAVATGSAVTVEAGVEVPPLIGLHPLEARRALEVLGLFLDARVRAPARGPFETIFEQRPAAETLVGPGSAVAVVFEALPDLPEPRWPWPWMVTTVALAGLLRYRVRWRRALRRSYRVVAHSDLAGLRASADVARWPGGRPRLDLRVRGFPDPGRQTLVSDGPLVMAEVSQR